MTKLEIQKHLRAQKTMYELAGHPALSDSAVFSLLELMAIDIALVCKQGHIEPYRQGCIDVRYTQANYKKYKEEFDKEFRDYTPEELKKEKVLIWADVPYKKVYGEEWKPDHIEYWGELSFVAFIGKNFKVWHDRHKWTHFVGVSASGRTFEEMIVNLGKRFFNSFGKFNTEDFMTQAEKKNHENEKVFFSKPCKDYPKCSELISNPKYKKILASDINRRWVKWYNKNKVSKEQWGTTFNDILAGKEVR